jgi:hypothetical protein
MEKKPMQWNIKHIFNFPREKRWSLGYAQFGFHDNQGNQYFYGVKRRLVRLSC